MEGERYVNGKVTDMEKEKQRECVCEREREREREREIHGNRTFNKTTEKET